MTTANATNQDTLRIVKSIVEEMLQERFSEDDITFTEIKVENLIDYYGEDYIDVRIFYTGQPRRFRPQVDSRLLNSHRGRDGTAGTCRRKEPA